MVDCFGPYQLFSNNNTHRNNNNNNNNNKGIRFKGNQELNLTLNNNKQITQIQQLDEVTVHKMWLFNRFGAFEETFVAAALKAIWPSGEGGNTDGWLCWLG